jgi:ketosteroid isomerase-like protein
MPEQQVLSPPDGQTVEFLNRIYGFNWANLGGREKAFDALAEAVVGEFELRLSPEIGERTISGLIELKAFADALEQDFEECSYEAEEFVQGTDDRVMVSGSIFARGRSSRLPLSGLFAHVWTVRDGKAVSSESYRDREQALRAAGLDL